MAVPRRRQGQAEKLPHRCDFVDHGFAVIIVTGALALAGLTWLGSVIIAHDAHLAGDEVANGDPHPVKPPR